MTPNIFVVTGTDTGVGKTVLAVLITQHLRKRGGRVAAIKPISLGNRGDAEALRDAAGGVLTLDEVNPWHFPALQAPLLAARARGICVELNDVLTHLRKVRASFDALIIEGAGGLLTPLGEGFSTRDLIVALRATPIVVSPNRLGTINQTRLVLAALPRNTRHRAQIVLVAPRRPDSASATNRKLLGEFVNPDCVHMLPWLPQSGFLPHAQRTPHLRRVLQTLLGSVRSRSQNLRSG